VRLFFSSIFAFFFVLSLREFCAIAPICMEMGVYIGVHVCVYVFVSLSQPTMRLLFLTYFFSSTNLFTLVYGPVCVNV